MAIIGVWLEVEAQKFNVAAQPLSYELYLKPIMGRTTDDAVVEERQAELAAVLDIYEARLGKSRKVYDISTYALVIVVHLYTYDICTYAFLVHMRPFGQIPAFQDGDLNLFESRAITRYIAHSYAGKGAPLVSSDAKEGGGGGRLGGGGGSEVRASSGEADVGAGNQAHLEWQQMNVVVKAQETELEKVLDVYEPRLRTPNTWRRPPLLSGGPPPPPHLEISYGLAGEGGFSSPPSRGCLGWPKSWLGHPGRRF
ncbi:hypothetical protein SASPL_157485 [Salvia splendens]|uniref:glutathione transferase n=1 Tax=Salvia splendens TaxID=180675 RepID=A0A8X8YWB5_SALSN|nr:hypothetical protein SASPL_157485 [Salvia splendens]